MTSPTISSTLSTHMDLTTEMFIQALDMHLDETKPDLLALRQAKNWTLEWQDEPRESSTSSSGEGGSSEIKRQTHGKLLIQGDYVAVTLEATCDEWTTTSQATSTSDRGSLSFNITATAHVRKTFPVLESKKEERIAVKLRKQMIRRLQEDDYISRLLAAGEEETSTDADDDTVSSPLLCTARITTNPPLQLEERVYINQQVAEGIARCLYSQHPDAVLAILELLLSMPYLPTRYSKLAKRAKLRLLEDAMADACEKEEENELLEELNLKGEEKDQEEASDDSPPKAKRRIGNKQGS